MLFDFNGLYYLQHHRRYRSVNMLPLVGAPALVMLIVPLLGDVPVVALYSISITEVVLKKGPDYAMVDRVLGQAVPVIRLKYIPNYRPFKVKQ